MLFYFLGACVINTLDLRRKVVCCDAGAGAAGVFGAMFCDRALVNAQSKNSGFH